jgi:hypothetical protein
MQDTMYLLAVAETMPSARDEEILKRAHASIILLRLKEDIAATRVATIDKLLRQHSDRLLGSFTMVSEHNVRIRPILRLL